MPGRQFNSNSYKYGYQGSEKDNEISGEGNSYTTHYRGLDVRLGRWWSVDPKTSEQPHYSPYISMDNNPVSLNDVLGDRPPQFNTKAVVNAASSKKVNSHSKKAEAASKGAFSAEVGIGIGVGFNAKAGKYLNIDMELQAVSAKISTNMKDNSDLSISGPSAAFTAGAGSSKAKINANGQVSLLKVGVSYDKANGSDPYLVKAAGFASINGNAGGSSISKSTTSKDMAPYENSTDYKLGMNFGPGSVEVSTNPDNVTTMVVEMFNTAKSFLTEFFTSSTLNQFGTNPDKTSLDYAKNK